MDERFIRFLAGLEKLTRETGVEVVGCGCCGSPALVFTSEITPESGYAPFQGVKADSVERIQWISPGDFNWDSHKKDIVRATDSADAEQPK